MNQNMCRFNMIWFVFINVWLKCFSIIDSFENELFRRLHEKLICYWYKKCQRLNWNWNQRHFWWWKQIVSKNDYVVNIVRNIWSIDEKHVNQRHDRFDRKRFENVASKNNQNVDVNDAIRFRSWNTNLWSKNYWWKQMWKHVIKKNVIITTKHWKRTIWLN